MREIEATLRSRFADCRGLLRQNVAEARSVLQSLLTGRIEVTPHTDSPTSAPIFDVRIPLTTRGIFQGICGSQGVASPAGLPHLAIPCVHGGIAA